MSDSSIPSTISAEARNGEGLSRKSLEDPPVQQHGSRHGSHHIHGRPTRFTRRNSHAPNPGDATSHPLGLGICNQKGRWGWGGNVKKREASHTPHRNEERGRYGCFGKQSGTLQAASTEHHVTSAPPQETKTHVPKTRAHACHSSVVHSGQCPCTNTRLNSVVNPSRAYYSATERAKRQPALRQDESRKHRAWWRSQTQVVSFCS